MNTFHPTAKSLSFFASFALTANALAFECRPEVLPEILASARASVNSGVRPVVLFDLDDTLIDTRRRTHRILAELSEDAAFASAFPSVATQLRGIPYEQVAYMLSDTFGVRGIHDAEALAYAAKYWSERFFSDAYSAQDTQLREAAAYVRQLRESGAKIVYLTGRDEPRMGRGTRASLVSNGFPTESDEVRLILKPTAKTDDLEFKRSVFVELHAMGPVIAAFENEPANLNAMAAAFPESTPVFVDTIHSPKPDQPGATVAAVKDYTASGGCR